MQNITQPQIDRFIKVLPILNMLIIVPVAFIFQRSTHYMPLLCCIILGFATLSILSAIYKSETTNRNKQINPKRYLVFSISAALLIFLGTYLGLGYLASI
jgi:hypothetical protein